VFEEWIRSNNFVHKHTNSVAIQRYPTTKLNSKARLNYNCSLYSMKRGRKTSTNITIIGEDNSE